MLWVYGYSLSTRLLSEGHHVIGIDNINNYYSVQLKARLARVVATSENNSSSFVFGELDISDMSSLFRFLETHLVTAKKNTDLYFVNLAAQAGVRYSITNPDAYIESNIVGFSNVIQAAKVFDVNHFLYASSSSVSGVLIITKRRVIVRYALEFICCHGGQMNSLLIRTQSI